MILPRATRKSGRLFNRYGGFSVVGLILVLIRVGIRMSTSGNGSGSSPSSSYGGPSGLPQHAARQWPERAEESIGMVFESPGKAEEMGRKVVAAMYPDGTFRKMLPADSKTDGPVVRLILNIVWQPAAPGAKEEAIKATWEFAEAGPRKVEIIETSSKQPLAQGWQSAIGAWFASDVWPLVQKNVPPS